MIDTTNINHNDYEVIVCEHTKKVILNYQHDLHLHNDDMEGVHYENEEELRETEREDALKFLLSKIETQHNVKFNDEVHLFKDKTSEYKPLKIAILTYFDCLENEENCRITIPNKDGEDETLLLEVTEFAIN